MIYCNFDGDVIGLSFGFYYFFNKGGYMVCMIMFFEYLENFFWMLEIEKMVVYDIDFEYFQELVEKVDIIFCLDFNVFDCIDKFGDLIEFIKCYKVMIDYYFYLEGFVDFLFLDIIVSFICEFIVDFIYFLGMEFDLDVKIGECFFIGIIMDMGFFCYSILVKFYCIVGELVELGVDDYKLQDFINNSMKEKYLCLFGYCLNNCMEILEEYNIGIFYFMKQDYEDFDIQRGDIEGIVNYLLKIKNVKMVVFIMEQFKIVKIFLWFKGDFFVQEIV